LKVPHGEQGTIIAVKEFNAEDGDDELVAGTEGAPEMDVVGDCDVDPVVDAEEHVEPVALADTDADADADTRTDTEIVRDAPPSPLGVRVPDGFALNEGEPEADTLADTDSVLVAAVEIEMLAVHDGVTAADADCDGETLTDPDGVSADERVGDADTLAEDV
jgi:hypothetical protein